MFNLNLLPEKEKQNVLWETYSSQILYFGSFAVASIFIFLILLFPSYIFLALQNEDIARNLELEKKSQETMRIPAIANQINLINANTRRIIQHSASSFMPGAFLERINRIAEGRVLIDQIHYNPRNNQLHISGRAETRNKFLDFKNAIETEGKINNVISPISNIVKETDIQFSIDGTAQNQP